MKRILLTVVFLISAISFAQTSGSINGRLLDLESNNEPLVFAKVSIKETGAVVTSNENGEFIFSNLNEGIYTLVSDFVGYENKETKAIVVSGESTSITLSLEASTVSLEDIMMTLASADLNPSALTSQ